MSDEHPPRPRPRADRHGADPAPEPFTVDVPQTVLTDLHDRLDRTRWPDLPDLPGGPGWDAGVPRGYLRELARYWRHEFAWRAQEAALNRFPQLRAGIDGERIHLVHARSPEPDALPLLLTHGWPGSVAEFLRIIGPLTDPVAHGGAAADAFHVVAPSIPGFGFSGPTRSPGWDTRRVAGAFATLMERLGYRRFGAQGGDWGALIARELAALAPDRVAGVHVNYFPNTMPDEATLARLPASDRARLDGLRRYRRELSGYLAVQSTRPQTLAYALTDSPVGQLAWIVDTFLMFTAATHAPEEVVDRDQLLTDVTVYWVTGTAGSSARLYRESAARWGAIPRSDVPVGVAVFPAEVSPAVRSLAEREARIVHWSELPAGGHFAAMEQPDLLVEDIRAFFRQVR